MRTSRLILTAMAAMLSLSLSACDPASGLALDTGMNYSLRNATYMATDNLVKGAEGKMPSSVPLLVGTISDVNKLETSTPLGRTIAEQVSSRLVQDGFNVADVRFRNAINVKMDPRDKTADGEYFLSRDTSVLKGEQEVGAAVTGTYTIASNVVLVNLRIIEASTSRVISTTDYRIPMTDDIRAMTGGSGFFKPGAYAKDWNF